MRLKITLTLLAVLLGLLTYIFYIDNRSGSDEFENIRSSVLGELAVGIDYLSIENNVTGQTITLSLQNNRWMISEPYLWPANAFAVQSILTELRFLERISSFETNLVSESGPSLPDYGLMPSQIALKIRRGEQSSTLHIGKPTEIGSNLYILSTDEHRVHVVNRSLLDAISVNLDTLRSSQLFDIAVFEANSWNIQIREPDRNLRVWFARSGDNWVFETPIRARANSEAVNVLLNRCLSLEADSIIASSPSDLSPYGLQNPFYRIAVESDQTREVLEIGEKISPQSDFRYAKLESRPTVFQLRIDFLDLLANAQTKLRERRIFELDVTAATTATIEQRDQLPLTLQKLEDGNWELVLSDENGVLQTIAGDPGAISEMLKWLDELKAVPDTGFVNDAPSAPDLESYGLEVPEYSITITSNKPSGEATHLSELRTETLLVGDRSPNEGQESFVKIASKDFVYLTYNDIFSRIDNDPLRYKDRQIISLPPTSHIQGIRIERLSDREFILDETLDPVSHNDSLSGQLAQIISQLSVESYRSQGFTRTVRIAERQRPWAYRVSATVGSENAPADATQQIEIFVSETTGGPLLIGGIAQANQSFRFEQSFIDAFSQIVFDRVAKPAPAQPFSTTPLPANPTAPSPSNQELFETPEPEQSADTAQ